MIKKKKRRWEKKSCGKIFFYSKLNRLYFRRFAEFLGAGFVCCVVALFLFEEVEDEDEAADGAR